MHLCLQHLPCPYSYLSSFPTRSVPIQTLNVCPDLVRNRSIFDKVRSMSHGDMHDHTLEELGGTSSGLGGTVGIWWFGNETVFSVRDGFTTYPGLTFHSLWSPGWPQTVDTLSLTPKCSSHVLTAHVKVELCVKRQVESECEADPGLVCL